MADILAGRYRLDEKIGVGGVGTVWRAFDKHLHREVAVKTLDVTATHDDPEAVPRFRREAIAAAGLSHPNIVSVYDTGTDGDLAFLVMELLTGPSLRDLIRDEGFLHIDEGLRIAKPVGEGLAAAHAIGLIHRDIKPGNVMLHDDVPKIVDFGIARLEQEAGEALTRPATAIGTPAYIAPEQALGRQATPASDIYSFGCLLMTLFTGRPPFRAEQPLALTHAHVSELPPRLADLRPDVPPALDELVAQMLDKDPKARPSAKAVVRELSRIAADPAVASSLPTRHPVAAATSVLPVAEVPKPVSTPRRSVGATIMLVVLTLLLLTALAYGAMRFLNRTTPEPPPPAPTTQAPPPAPTPTTRQPSVAPTSAPPTTAAPTSSAPVPTQTVTVTATAPTTTEPPTPGPTTAPPVTTEPPAASEPAVPTDAPTTAPPPATTEQPPG